MLIFRFLHIASLAYLCSLIFKMASCHSLPVDLAKRGSVILRETPDIRRTYKLYNQCSGRHVQIFGKTVNAKGLSNSTHVNLSFISVHARHTPNAMNIVGEKSGRYLCFNKRGKLITRFSGRKRLCLFKEGFSEGHYTIIKSVHDPTWYVGFNRKGKALKGSLYSKSKLHNCFHFVKRDHNYGPPEPPKLGPIKDPSKLKDLLTGRGPFRHRRIVPTTPPPR